MGTLGIDTSNYTTSIAYFDGKDGGTKSTVQYAVKNGRELLNIYETDPVGEQNARYKAQLILIPPEDENI